MKNSKIEWTEHTFNPWHGCAKVSPGCKNCYAETMTKRFGGDIWGNHAPRKFMSDNYWMKPFSWNDTAQKAGRIDRVFCASMSDVFEIHQDADVQAKLNEARSRLFYVIKKTKNLMWLLLTKRPENVNRLLQEESQRIASPILVSGGQYVMPENVCIMTSVENQETADERIPKLLSVPAKYRALSVEPLLEKVNLIEHLNIDWVIVGGESGKGARPMNPEWVRSIRDNCDEASVPFFFKQWGAWKPGTIESGYIQDSTTSKWWGNHTYSLRVGKEKAGRLLDGMEYNDHPFNLVATKALL